jgi:hypothetical protein
MSPVCLGSGLVQEFPWVVTVYRRGVVLDRGFFAGWVCFVSRFSVPVGCFSCFSEGLASLGEWIVFTPSRMAASSRN